MLLLARIARNRATLWCVAAGLFTPSAFAQYDGLCHSTPLPHGAAGTGVDAMATGFFTNPHYADLVTLSSGVLEIVHGIGRVESEELLAQGVSSFAVMEGAGGLDQLVVLDPAGIHRLVSDGAGGLEAAEGSVLGGPWIGASDLCVPPGGSWVAGVSEDREKVCCASEGSWLDPITFSPDGGEVLELSALEWDGDGEPELAVLVGDSDGTSTLRIHRTDGSPVPGAQWTSTDLHNVLCPIPGFDGDADGLFWVTEVAPDFVLGVTLSRVGMAEPIAFGPLRIDSLATVAWDDDDLLDLVVANPGRNEVWILARSADAGLPPFSAQPAQDYHLVLEHRDDSEGPLVASNAAASALCAVADLNSDGDDDLVLARSFENDLWIVHSARAQDGSPSEECAPAGVAFLAADAESPHSGFKLTVEVPLGALQGGANSLAVSIYEGPTINEPYFMSANEPIHLRLDLGDAGSSTVEIAFNGPEASDGWDPGAILHVIVEPQCLEGGEVVDVFPPSFFLTWPPGGWISVVECEGQSLKRHGFDFQYLCDGRVLVHEPASGCAMVDVPGAASAPARAKAATSTGGVVRGNDSRRHSGGSTPPPGGEGSGSGG